MSPPIDQKGGSAPSEDIGQRDQSETASPAESGFPGPFVGRDSGFAIRHSDIVPKSLPAPDDGLDDPEVIAHEIGNKLAIIKNALSLLLKELPADLQKKETVSEVLRVLHEEHEDIGHILRRVRASAHDAISPMLPEEVPEHVLIDLSETIEAEVKLWRRVLRTKIAITRDFAQGIKIRGDHVELHELIHNIFKNAVEIMMQLPEEERKLHVRMRKKKGFIQVFVHDNGPGISAEDKEKLFKKRFTKKKGKGIGLFYSQVLARKMGGDIVIMNTDDLLEIKDLDQDDGQSSPLAIEPDVPPKNDAQEPGSPGIFRRFVSLVKRTPTENETLRVREINIADFRGAVAIIEFPDPEEEVR